MRTFKKIVSMAAVAAMCGIVFGVPSDGRCDDANKQIIAELQQIKNPAKPISIKFAAANDVKTAKIGDTVSFVFAADQDCYLYIIDVGTSGKAHILFPNKWQKGNKAAKGKVYKVPPEGSKVVFRVHGPEGINYLKAIATLDPIKKLEKAEEKSDSPFAELTNPTAQFKDVAAELEKQDGKKWAEAEISIKVVKP